MFRCQGASRQQLCLTRSAYCCVQHVCLHQLHHSIQQHACYLPPRTYPSPLLTAIAAQSPLFAGSSRAAGSTHQLSQNPCPEKLSSSSIACRSRQHRRAPAVAPAAPATVLPLMTPLSQWTSAAAPPHHHQLPTAAITALPAAAAHPLQQHLHSSKSRRRLPASQ